MELTRSRSSAPSRPGPAGVAGPPPVPRRHRSRPAGRRPSAGDLVHANYSDGALPRSCGGVLVPVPTALDVLENYAARARRRALGGEPWDGRLEQIDRWRPDTIDAMVPADPEAPRPYVGRSPYSHETLTALLGQAGRRCVRLNGVRCLALVEHGTLVFVPEGSEEVPYWSFCVRAHAGGTTRWVRLHPALVSTTNNAEQHLLIYLVAAALGVRLSAYTLKRYDLRHDVVGEIPPDLPDRIAGRFRHRIAAHRDAAGGVTGVTAYPHSDSKRSFLESMARGESAFYSSNAKIDELRERRPAAAAFAEGRLVASGVPAGTPVRRTEHRWGFNALRPSSRRPKGGGPKPDPKRNVRTLADLDEVDLQGLLVEAERRVYVLAPGAVPDGRGNVGRRDPAFALATRPVAADLFAAATGTYAVVRSGGPLELVDATSGEVVATSPLVQHEARTEPPASEVREAPPRSAALPNRPRTFGRFLVGPREERLGKIARPSGTDGLRFAEGKPGSASRRPRRPAAGPGT